jgi:hypothetical protein
MLANGGKAWSPSAWRPSFAVGDGGDPRRFGLGFPAIPLAWGLFLNWGVPFILATGALIFATSAVKEVVPSIPINKENIPIASALGGSALGVYFMGQVLPATWSPVFYAAAAAAAGASLYLLFSGADTEGTVPSSEVSEKERIPVLPTTELNKLFEVTLDPFQVNTGGTVRNAYATQEYEFTIRNKSDTPVTVFAGLEVILENYGVRTSVFTSKPNMPPPIGRSRITIPAKGAVTTKLAVPPVVPFGSSHVQVQLFRNLDDLIWALASPLVPFQSSPVG